MGRSNGARARKEVAEEARVLRARLAELGSDEWVKAQMIFDNLCLLVGCKGPSGAMQSPRQCRACHGWGHTRQHCPKLKARELRDIDREYERIKRLPAYHAPTCREDEAFPGQFARIAEQDAILSRVAEARAAGMGCDVGGYTPDCSCGGCTEWRSWFGER